MALSRRTSVLCGLFIYCITVTTAAKPCASRPYPGQSVVCVCNATYCDDVTRISMQRGTYVVYTSSAAGQRLSQRIGKLKTNSTFLKRNHTTTLRLNPARTYQKIEGFGGAVTDSAAINWKNLSKPLQRHLINSYYGEKGIGYSLARVPIAGCDFSVRPYAYNELPINDTKLSNFSLSIEDFKYKIPMLKAIMNATKTPLKVVAAAWRVPDWMKEKNNYNKCGQLKKEFKQTYADYLRKFIEQYNAHGVPVWAVSTSNEPIMGFLNLQTGGDCIGWYPKDMGEWIADNLGPTIRNMTQKVLILGVDDQRFALPIWFYAVVKYKPEALKYIDGLAIHFYGDVITPPSILEDVSRSNPDKFLIYTEACNGPTASDKEKVILGSWDRAETYMKNIITDINHNVVGWIDWNLCLNEMGGPNWIKNYVDSPIIVFASRGEFVKQPMFYAMAHVAKFVPRGSKRIEVMEDASKQSQVKQFAVLTPSDTIVVVLCNGANSTASVGIRLGDQQLVLELQPRSFTTVEFHNEVNDSCRARTMIQNVPGRISDVDYDANSISITYKLWNC
ncbi:lysosomal acid glucosylceramidase-like [Pectinophora gossypiella]|uniref:lysosomal acid glucosylceramidase-like n=1 Tax=Pectinophora gossypiella TaxID=13191 RepID=UPI00214F1C56|nr:lysosomal acid glucosylceramidase-like [Pectinophora gossypiella]